MKECCACKETKELKLFYKNNAIKGGYSARCKKCVRNNKLCRQGRPIGSVKKVKETKTNGYKDSFIEIRLVNTRKEDYVETYKFLKRIGYKLDESIHEQFCKMHDLEPTPAKEFLHHFSPKDCGMT
jgi:uncharacterized protein YpbB